VDEIESLVDTDDMARQQPHLVAFDAVVADGFARAKDAARLAAGRALLVEEAMSRGIMVMSVWYPE